MKEPDERAFGADIEDAPFRIGVNKGDWGLAASELLPEDLKWPFVVLWISAAPRNNAPDRFYVKLNCFQYPLQAPTGAFWDPKSKQALAFNRRPKGTGQVAKVFRTDWEGGQAFYHPYDRVAALSHPDWPNKYPHLIWTRNCTIVDLLTELYSLLNCHEYTGI